MLRFLTTLLAVTMLLAACAPTVRVADPMPERVEDICFFGVKHEADEGLVVFYWATPPCGPEPALRSDWTIPQGASFFLVLRNGVPTLLFKPPTPKPSHDRPAEQS